eukprot:scaffold97744_cov42-Attheya_sp.AAC.1
MTHRCSRRPSNVSISAKVVSPRSTMAMIVLDHAASLGEGSLTRSWRRSKIHPRNTWVSARPPSAVNFLRANSSSLGMGSLPDRGRPTM